VILSGPQGSGKYTLAQMVAKAMNCLERPVSDDLPDYCGRCSNCVRIAAADALEERFTEAVEARENLRDADKRETRILVQTHPDVMIIPPDPPQMLVKVDQVRHVIHEIYYKPVEGRERVYIFSDADFMKEAANSLLKVLEEPPEFATIFLLTDNPTALLPTIRSRCMHLRLAPLAADEIEPYLAQVRPEWKARERALVARVCGGGLGRARSFDLAGCLAARQDALAVLAPAMGTKDHSALFRVTDTYRAGADGKAKTEQLLRTLYALLEDLLFVKSGTPELVRNHDVQAELTKMAAQVDFAWITSASQRLGEVESGMRRNLLRSLSLDAFATSLEQ
jgi:DNA polymerase-3 subunit delta'